ncbi:MAG: ABC transporter permease [Streptosporangiales bacterium]
MSSPDTLARDQTPTAAAARPNRLGLFTNELAVVFRRLRTIVLLACYAAVPVLFGFVLRFAADPGASGGDAPGFIASVTQNGLFLPFLAMFFLLPLFLPVGVAVVAGDSVAGEAHLGTLRYLLVAPAGRVRLLAAKLVSVFAFCLVAPVVVAVFGLLVGLALFPHTGMPLLTGTTISYGQGLWRVFLVTCYVAASLTGIGMIGLFASTLTEAPLGAMAATVATPLVSQILGAVPQLAVIQPYLPTHQWLTFVDLLRDPIYTPNLLNGLLIQLVYVLVFTSAAYARITTRDVA